MNKKMLVFLTVLSLVLLGCSNDTKGTKKSKDKLKVALLVSFQGDMSFNDSAVRGVKDAEKASENMEVKILEYGMEADKFEPALVDSAESGYDVIIASATNQEYFETHAPSYPDVTFIMYDGEVDYSSGDFDNIYSIVYSANEGAFLGGYVAAKTSKTGVIGFLGGTEAPIILDFLVGYIQGAKQANPDIKVVVSYVGNFSDSSKGKELSFAMNNKGADIIFIVGGSAGVGAIDAGVEANFMVLGVDSD
ncbi:MAG: BMP family ABC transporter substrate-binding protein, partial [Bacilli bacterium]